MRRDARRKEDRRRRTEESKVTEKITDAELSNTVGNDGEEMAENVVENTVRFNCDQCDYQCDTDQGLKIHRGRKHKVIPQIDGAHAFSVIEEDETVNNHESSDANTTEDTTEDTTKNTTKELTPEEFQKLKDAINDWRRVL